MFVNELAEPTLIVVYPGRFQPFHKGHHKVFEWLTSKFGRNNVFIATSNKVEPPRSPFSFAEKAYFMQLTGVPADRILQSSQPYRIETLTDTGLIPVNDPNNTVVIFAVSEKDMAEDPRFASWTKKDGTPAYFQPLKNIKDTKSMKEHAYILTVPTFDFTVLGNPMRSGTELRQMFVEADQKTRQLIIKDLFGRYTAEAEQLMTAKLVGTETAAPARPAKLPKTTPAAGTLKEADLAGDDPGRVSLMRKAKLAHPFADSDEEALALYINDKETWDVKELNRDEHDLETKVRDLELQFAKLTQRVDSKLNEGGGVGVVKDGNDPRYVMATAGDQNDVDGSTLGKGMAAYHLVGAKKSKTGLIPVTKNIGKGLNEAAHDLRQQILDYAREDMLKLENKLRTETDPRVQVQIKNQLKNLREKVLRLR